MYRQNSNTINKSSIYNTFNFLDIECKKFLFLKRKHQLLSDCERLFWKLHEEFPSHLLRVVGFLCSAKKKTRETGQRPI